MVAAFYYQSPIGCLEIALIDNTIISVKLVEKLSDDLSNSVVDRSDILEIRKQLDEYFAGIRREFDLQILPSGTVFQQQVWSALRKIPYGSTTTYQAIAEKIGNPNAQRAVGKACNQNPILIFIPCHRVISKSGSINGFACGVAVKKTLLKLEGGV